MSPLARFLALGGIALGATAAVLFWGGIVHPVSISFQMPTPTPRPGAILAVATAVSDSAATTEESAGEAAVSAPPPLDVNRAMPAWERQIELTAVSPAKNAAERARAVLALLPALPEEALPAAAERAVDVLPNADYAAVALPVVTNPLTHHRAMSVLFADLMERPDAIALPALLAIARNPAHAFAPSAQENLQLLLGADFGNDWGRWETEIQHVLTGAKR